jgi:hypothetical protein
MHWNSGSPALGFPLTTLLSWLVRRSGDRLSIALNTAEDEAHGQHFHHTRR